MIPAIEKHYDPVPEDHDDPELDLEVLKKAKTWEEYRKLCSEKSERS